MIGTQPVFSLEPARVPRIVWWPYGIFDVFEGGADLIAQLGEPGAGPRFLVVDRQDKASYSWNLGNSPV
jgi:hypothetical protein